MEAIRQISYWLLVIGGLNWGLVGLGLLLGGANWDVVNLLLGGIPYLAEVVYVLVGAAAIVSVVSGGCRKCMPKGGGAPGQPQM